MENKMKYLAIGVVAIIIVAAVGVFLMQDNGDDDNEGGVIIQKGSDTLLELCQIWAEEYMAENPAVEVEVSGGGSGTGITALINGQVDIAQASRQIKASEIESAQAAGFTPVEFKVAIDGIAIIVHTSNDVGVLTVEQLRGIYNGTITNWAQVGGADTAITLYGRQSTSGTYEYFWEHVLQKENYSQSMNMLSGNSAIVSAVQGDEGGVGYVGIGYADASGINVLDLKKDSSSEAFAPTDESAVKSGKYDLSRYLYLYTKGVPTGIVKDYLRWIVSFDDGQSMVGEIGFYEISQNAYEDNLVKMGATPAPVTLSQKGSDTMLELCQIFSEDFHEEFPWITVEITGGGSGTGISALINKQVDLAQASRSIKASEITAANANGVYPVEFRVAIDGIAVITSDGNGVTELTKEQLKGIYNGTYTNWNQVGGADLGITLYGRQSSSGTYVYFQEEVLGNENYSMDMNMLTGNSAIVAAVQGDAGGIGYVGIGYANTSGIKVLSLMENEGDEAFNPLDEEAVLSGDYLLSRYLYVYTDSTPTDQVSRWLSWVLSAEGGQSVVAEIGFYPLPQAVVEQELAKLG
ncbi:MAG TPA: phosphate ABC transporter substrate-binding protein [Methanomassiliicoccales archaeon]|nr:phosphate ABC transporter substrate-binding protein [Methanomassiliicoccales archaeon]